jgi:hypothetical protein
MDFLQDILEAVRAENHPPRDLSSLSFVCATCQQTHSGIFDLGCDGPQVYLASSTEEKEQAFQKSDDLCTWNSEHFFVRCILPIPVHGVDEYFAYGVWSSLSKENFELYREHWDHPASDGLGPWFGWFSNHLKAYPETASLKCRVHPQDGGQRPLLELEPCDHPLAMEQRQGITVERLLEIYAANGHGTE